MNREPKRGTLLDHTGPPSRAAFTTRRIESTTSSGRSNWVWCALFFATTSSLFSERSIRPASAPLVCSSARFAYFVEPGYWHAPALMTTSSFSLSEVEASVASATLFWTVADSSATA